MTSHFEVDPYENIRLIKLSEVTDLLSVSRSTIYRWVDEDLFPRPVVLGLEGEGKRSAVRWRKKDVIDFIKSRAETVKNDS